MQDDKARKFFVIVSGNIGVGKSTLVKMLAEEFHWTPYLELIHHDQHPYLEDYYQDMHKWGFETQLYFLILGLKQHQEITTNPFSSIQDRSMYEHFDIFARSMLKQKILEQRDFDVLNALHQNFVRILPKPDLLIHLDGKLPTLAQRITKRGRDYEKNIPKEYLEDLNRLYGDWIENFSLCPKLRINTNTLAIPDDPVAFQYVVGQVREKLGLVE